MRKGFTRKPKSDEPATPVKNYITPSGLERLKDEHRFLLTRERPAVVEVVAWAASNGDRSDNADYWRVAHSSSTLASVAQYEGRHPLRPLTQTPPPASETSPPASESGPHSACASMQPIRHGGFQTRQKRSRGAGTRDSSEPSAAKAVHHMQTRSQR
jgi:hypothetical protein